MSELRRYTTQAAFAMDQPEQTIVTEVFGLSQDTIVTRFTRNSRVETYTFRLPVVTVTLKADPAQSRRVMRFAMGTEIAVETQDGNAQMLSRQRHSTLPDGSLIVLTEYPDGSWRRTRTLGQADGTGFGLLNASGRQAFAINVEANGGTSTSRGHVVFYDKANGAWNPSLVLSQGDHRGFHAGFLQKKKMAVKGTPMQVITHQDFLEVYTRDSAGVASRLEAILEVVHGEVTFEEAIAAGPDDIKAIHTAAHIASVRRDRLFKIAALAAGASIQAALTGLTEPCFALVRPPGHHASADNSWGFCYFNNMAIALDHLKREGLINTAYVLDFDLHFGDGTVSILGRTGYTLIHNPAANDRHTYLNEVAARLYSTGL